MKQRFFISLFAFAAVIGILALAVLTTPPNPTAFIKVLDAAGQPVPGAIVKTYALRPKNGGADYFWTDRMSVKPLPVRTDRSGIARVPFPHYILEKLETGEISFTVNHPDFCKDHFVRNVAFAPPENAVLWKRVAHPVLVLLKRAPARPDAVRLKHGGILRVSAFVESKDKLLTNIHPQVSSIDLPETNFWQDSPDGWRTTRRVNEGSNALRIAWFPGDGKIWFSDVVSFLAKPSQTNEFQLQLRPALRLAGKLDDAALRPITGGRVQLHVVPTNMPTGTDALHWESTRTINADGTFAFESLPPGRVEVIAICDGFVSVDGSKATGLRLPQVFTLDETNLDIVVKMEPTATCEITVQDDQGHPLPGADVAFWPNVQWEGRFSTIFARDSFNWEDILPTGHAPDWDSVVLSHNHQFGATTDARGVAVVSNLPAFNREEPFSAGNANYEMSIDRSHGDEGRNDRIRVQAGVTNRTTVKLLKKGTELMRPKK